MQNARDVLQRVFGYDAFIGKQEEVISALLAGKSVLALMPTGGGKSLCFQIPALVLDGTVIVVSPLIALMKDQVDALQQHNIRAAYLNSSLTPKKAEKVLADFTAGELDLLYIAPERLLAEDMMETIKRVSVAAVAVDEAHCISQWGHDFRREYARLGRLAAHLPHTPILATTATADQQTRADIIRQLRLDNPQLIIASFDRPNIHYEIRDKRNVKADFLNWYKTHYAGEAGIVYCLSRDDTERAAEWLREMGVNALPYHAGLPAKLRAQNQHAFTHEEGVVVCATIAFGMGINKPNVRFVAHWALPKNVESYYQETGRAGRDGLPANALLYYGMRDIYQVRNMIENSNAAQSVRQIHHNKFNRLLAMCEAAGCRRRLLLRYFDEDYTPPCGQCDNCKAPPATYDGTIDAQKLLSAVARCDQRFGVGHIVDVLVGKESPKVLQNHHEQIKTFGVGRDKPAVVWRNIAQQLIAGEWVDVDFEHGVLSLNVQSRKILKGELSVNLREPPARKPKATKGKGEPGQKPRAVEALPDGRRGLFEQLRAQRMRLSRAGGVPPYAIFYDTTLVAMATQMPQTIEELGSIDGVSVAKQSRYGNDFLAIIQKWSGR